MGSVFFESPLQSPAMRTLPLPVSLVGGQPLRDLGPVFLNREISLPPGLYFASLTLPDGQESSREVEVSGDNGRLNVSFTYPNQVESDQEVRHFAWGLNCLPKTSYPRVRRSLPGQQVKVVACPPGVLKVRARRGALVRVDAEQTGSWMVIPQIVGRRGGCLVVRAPDGRVAALPADPLAACMLNYLGSCKLRAAHRLAGRCLELPGIAGTCAGYALLFVNDLQGLARWGGYRREREYLSADDAIIMAEAAYRNQQPKEAEQWFQRSSQSGLPAILYGMYCLHKRSGREGVVNALAGRLRGVGVADAESVATRLAVLPSPPPAMPGALVTVLHKSRFSSPT